MKIFRSIVLTAGILVLLHLQSTAQEVKVEVVDFHSTSRCITCNAIEANAKKTVETFFGANKTVSFVALNVDEQKNKLIAEEFKAHGSSLFLKITRQGKSEIINLTQFAFMNGRNEEKFMTGLKQEIEKYL